MLGRVEVKEGVSEGMTEGVTKGLAVGEGVGEGDPVRAGEPDGVRPVVVTSSR